MISLIKVKKNCLKYQRLLEKILTELLRDQCEQSQQKTFKYGKLLVADFDYNFFVIHVNKVNKTHLNLKGFGIGIQIVFCVINVNKLKTTL